MKARARRRRRLVLLAPGAALLLALVLAPGARAHEFSLALVSTTSAEGDAIGRDLVAGFRLAVDESPDVSHPPGTEAGDHLGGVDVDIRVIEAAGARTAGVREAVAAGASVVVVLGTSSEAAAAVGPALAGTDVLVVDAGPEPPTAPPGSAGLLRLRDQGGEGTGSSVAAVRFASAFEQRHGRPASEWAARGYDAARLLDISLGRLGADSRDVEAMATAANASADLVRSTVVASLASPQDGPSAPPPAAKRPLFGPGTAVAGTVALAAVLLAVTAYGRRRRRSAAQRRSRAFDEPVVVVRNRFPPRWSRSWKDAGT